MSVPKPRLSWFLILVVVGFLMGLFASSGCGGMETPNWLRTKPKPSPPVAHISMSCPPVAADFDGDGENDGVPVLLMFYANTEGAITAIRPDGTVKMGLYVGKHTGKIPANVKPHQTWTLTAAELASCEGTQMKLVSYRVPLRWKTAPPKGRITFSCLFTPASGDRPQVAAEPVILPYYK
ncbi:MAG: hypothetical protein HN909_01700 [Phycisphaerales bacterium]|jgi:hypothetical protein|nr:hypothetical protein [Phycisphaerales bacterium]MBT7170463.1 hypothetical protein [Phycisphaerales bacterium]